MSWIVSLIFIPTLAFAKVVPNSAFVKLQKPTLLKPANVQAGQPYTFGPYVLPVMPDGRVVQMNPNMPDYLKRLNCGIPGYTGTGQPAQCWSILNYKKEDPNALGKAENMAGGSPMGGGPGGGGGGGNSPYAPSNMTPGSPYQGGNDGGWYSSGPDTLCTGTTSFQTKKPNSLLSDKNLSLCDVIYNAIKNPSCGGGPGPSTAEYARSLGETNIQDMEEFCPGWNTIKNNEEKRALVLMNFVAAIVKTESGWKNTSQGDGGTSLGMLQLTTSTDRRHGCHCQSLTNELDAQKNLECGTHMIVSFMAKDQTVGHGSGTRGQRSPKGIARSFGPFRDGRKERADIKRRISKWCSTSLQQSAPYGAPASVPAQAAK